MVLGIRTPLKRESNHVMRIDGQREWIHWYWYRMWLILIRMNWYLINIRFWWRCQFLQKLSVIYIFLAKIDTCTFLRFKRIAAMEISGGTLLIDGAKNEEYPKKGCNCVFIFYSIFYSSFIFLSCQKPIGETEPDSFYLLFIFYFIFIASFLVLNH